MGQLQRLGEILLVYTYIPKRKWPTSKDDFNCMPASRLGDVGSLLPSAKTALPVAAR
jgi:hypothetical protein